MGELIHRSFITVPYGATVEPHNVFKVTALQHIGLSVNVYRFFSALVVNGHFSFAATHSVQY